MPWSQFNQRQRLKPKECQMATIYRCKFDAFSFGTIKFEEGQERAGFALTAAKPENPYSP